MKDKYGVFYYPAPANKKFKMYVRNNEGVIEFRLHNQDDPKLWEEHGWISFEAAKQAAEMYKERGNPSPLHLYDFDVAVNVLRDEQKK